MTDITEKWQVGYSMLELIHSRLRESFGMSSIFGRINFWGTGRIHMVLLDFDSDFMGAIKIFGFATPNLPRYL